MARALHLDFRIAAFTCVTTTNIHFCLSRRRRDRSLPGLCLQETPLKARNAAKEYRHKLHRVSYTCVPGDQPGLQNKMPLQGHLQLLHSIGIGTSIL